MQEPAAGNEAVYTMKEAAQLRGVSYHTVSRAIRNHTLACTRMGRQALIRESDLLAWQPMVERRPRKYVGARVPDPGVRPSVVMPGGPAAAARSLGQIAPLLAMLGEESAPGPLLQAILDALAAALGCRDAAILARIPGGRFFEVRAATGAKRDWLAMRNDGTRVIAQPIRLAGRPLALFAGIPDPGRPALSGADRDAALAMLTLAALVLAE